MTKNVFSAVFRYKDEVFGTAEERPISGETPYDIFWKLFCDHGLHRVLEGLKKIKVVHVPSGRTVTATVDFDGVDEHGFSAPCVVNEERLDAWIGKCGVSVELPEA